MTQRPVRKLLALVLSLLLVLAFMPTALAEGQDATGGNPQTGEMNPADDPDPAPDPVPREPEEDTDPTTTVVAKIGEKEYTDLAEAFKDAAAAGSATTITLVSDVTLDQAIVLISGEVKLDLGEKKISGSAPTLFDLREGAKLTVDNGTIDATNDAFSVYGDETYAQNNPKNTTLILGKTLTVTSATSNCVYIRGAKAQADIYATLTSNGTYAVIQGNGTHNQNADKNYGGTIVNIYDPAKITQSNSTITAIYQPQDGELNVSGGYISGGDGIGIKSGVLNVSGGEIIATGPYVADVQPNSDGINSSGSAIMIDANDAYVGNVQISITGGKITSQQGDAVREVGKGDSLVSINVSGDAELSALNAERNDISVTNDHVDPETSKVSVTSGTFSKGINDRYLDDNALSIKSGENYYVGEAANKEIASAADGETIEVLNGTEITDVPEGVKVTNKTEGTITVDGTEVEKDEDYTVPVTPKPEPSKPSTSFTEPSYYPDYDEDVEYLPPVEDEEEEEKAPLYMVTCRTLNVRMGPGTSYAKLGTLSRGTLISGEYENGWVKFTYNGQTAYSSADYLMQVDGDLSGLHVTCRTLNVRAGAGTNFDILGTLSRGTEISVRDVLPGWYEIDFLSGIGYVSSAYIG